MQSTQPGSEYQPIDVDAIPKCELKPPSAATRSPLVAMNNRCERKVAPLLSHHPSFLPYQVNLAARHGLQLPWAYIPPTPSSLSFGQFFLLLVGLPGSGKSTFARSLEETMPYKVRSNRVVLSCESFIPH